MRHHSEKTLVRGNEAHGAEAAPLEADTRTLCHMKFQQARAHLYPTDRGGYRCRGCSLASSQRQADELFPGLSDVKWLVDRNVSLRPVSRELSRTTGCCRIRDRIVGMARILCVSGKSTHQRLYFSQPGFLETLRASGGLTK